VSVQDKIFSEILVAVSI